MQVHGTVESTCSCPLNRDDALGKAIALANGMLSPWAQSPTATRISPSDLQPHNIEFSCPAALAQPRMELPRSIQRSRRPLRGQLQRQVMITIRVVACMAATCLPQRTRNQADSWKQPFRSRQRADRYTNKWVAIRLASIQFRRTLPAPSHLFATIATTHDNPRDGAPERTSPYGTCS